MELVFSVTERRGFRILMCLHTAEPVPQEQWDEMMQQVGCPEQQDPKRSRMLVITDGGAPDARQRSQLRQVWGGGHAVQLSIVVPGFNSALKRGLMTAITWVNPAAEFFTPAQIDAALTHLDLTGELPSLWPEWRKLASRLRPNRTLHAIAAQAQLVLDSPEANSSSHP